MSENILLFAFKDNIPESIDDHLAVRAIHLRSRLKLNFPRYLQRIDKAQAFA